MVSAAGTPRRSGASRPRKPPAQQQSSSKPRPSKKTAAASATDPPKKKLRYIPGGPGGGGRYVDENGVETPVGGTGPGGYNYTGPRGRIGRENAANGVQPVVYPKRNRSTRTRTVAPRSQQPPMRFSSSSAAQAAAAVVQNDGYKPREERGWEEFHPDLDIDARLRAYSAREVDGVLEIHPTTPAEGTSTDVNEVLTPSKLGTPQNVVIGEAAPSASVDGESSAIPGLLGTPLVKRRPGRPFASPINAARAVSGSVATVPKIAPLQNQSAKEKLTLPQPSYRKTNVLARFEEKSAGQAQYVTQPMANVGYQQTDLCVRPEHYIKWVDSSLDEDMDTKLVKVDTDSNSAGGGGTLDRVEYDMDEQDDMWLEEFNAARKALDMEPVTREIFEITITKIEKEWHALEKRIPKPNPKPPQTGRPRSSSAAAVNGEPQAGEEQDSKCAICDDGDCENTNAIVFCDGCDLAVHQECYGVPFIPEGQWMCRKCQLAGNAVPTCIFCPNTDGAFKQTNSSKWAHLLCSMWIPEVSLGNHTFMEPVMDVEKVPRTRWKLNCYLCNQKMGACIQCGNKSCYQAFHVTCARRARLYLKMKNNHGTLAVLDGQTVLKAFCDKHCPQDYAHDNDVVSATRDARRYYKRTMRGRLWADSQAAALALATTQEHSVVETSREDVALPGTKLSITIGGGGEKKKAPQAQSAIWKLPSGAPVIPAVVYDCIESYLSRFNIRKRKEYVADMCKYWTLKREARRGAPLIKRFQLQNETFSSMEMTRRNFAGMGSAGRPRLDRRSRFAEMLVNDLAKLRDLCHETTARELEKLQLAELEVATIESLYYPICKLLPPILEKADAMDSRKIFTEGFDKIADKLTDRLYPEPLPFARDLAKAMNEGLDRGLPDVDDTLENAEASSPSKRAVFELRERKKLVKRVIKVVQPLLENTVHAQADLIAKPVDGLLEQLESILESSLQSPQKSTANVKSDDIGNGTVGDPQKIHENESGEPGELVPAVGGHKREQEDEPMLDQDQDAPGEEDDQPNILTPLLSGDDVGTLELSIRHAKNGGNDDLSNQKRDEDPLLSLQQQPAPPTPPISNGGINSSSHSQEQGNASAGSTLTDGGIPWYLRPLEPVGATVVETKYGGREAAMSEELSEIGDEELNGMSAEMEGMESLEPKHDVVEETTDPVVVAVKKAKSKKRKRNW